ncbi:MAG: hypothetical protein JSV25_16035 [Spirochaetota bacterium]|nr:MAG: hypothetical protein JSV25_16035 [Spirochaetota bacterium]
MKYSYIFFGAVFFILCSVIFIPAQDIEPDEPEIILPSVVLEIEDLSVEKIRSGLPEEIEQPLPWREYPLPEPEELEIEESSFEISAPDEEHTAPEEGRRDLIAEVTLGAGIPSHFIGSISLFKFGELPEGKLLFHHEMLDGIGSNSPGIGYNMREDILEGMVRFDIGDVEFKTDGEFVDLERGLQGNSNFYSKINRRLSGDISLKYAISDQFILKGRVDGSVSSQLLTGTSFQQINEFLISPEVTGELQMENWYLGITPELSYRNVLEKNGLLTTRFQLRVDVGIDIGEKYRIDAQASWFYSEASNHLFPFYLGLTGTPTDFFMFRVNAGYKLLQYNLKDIFAEYEFSSVPDTLLDNHGWFVDLMSRLYITDRWMLNAEASFMKHSGMFTVDKSIDPVTGLFTPDQVEALSLNVLFGARWNITDRIFAQFNAGAEFLDRPQFFPQYSLGAQLDATQEEGKYGGGVSADLLLGEHDYIQVPILDLYGFYRPADFIKFQLDINDLLLPIVSQQRYSWYPYIEEGFKITLKTQINF